MLKNFIWVFNLNPLIVINRNSTKRTKQSNIARNRCMSDTSTIGNLTAFSTNNLAGKEEFIPLFQFKHKTNGNK